MSWQEHPQVPKPLLQAAPAWPRPAAVLLRHLCHAFLSARSQRGGNWFLEGGAKSIPLFMYTPQAHTAHKQIYRISLLLKCHGGSRVGGYEEEGTSKNAPWGGG